MTQRPPLPPFTRETAIQKIRAAEDTTPAGPEPSRKTCGASILGPAWLSCSLWP